MVSDFHYIVTKSIHDNIILAKGKRKMLFIFDFVVCFV